VRDGTDRDDDGPGDPEASLWLAHARHATRLFARGPAPVSVISSSWCYVVSGAPHVDLNQAALYGGGAAADARALADLAVQHGWPLLLGCSRRASRDVAGPLAEAGFVRLPETEHLFWMPGIPAEASGPFAVRQIADRADVATLEAMFVEVHGYEPAMTRAMFGAVCLEGGDVTGWIAWDGDEAVSLAIVTQSDASLELWEVMTPARHRRRGAARAVIVAALHGAASAAAQPVERTLLWSSPAGRPLYDALGFQTGDDIAVWALGASPEDLAAVGAG
jgi:hypothetical protein